MGTVILELLPMILGSAIMPVAIIVVIVLLMGEKGTLRAAAWIAGMSVVRLAQGIVFGFVYGAAHADDSASGPSPITSTLLLVWRVVRHQRHQSLPEGI
jgi:hypothetical protein